ncbi:Mbov_0398 family ICE element protein [[Mycoplasma] collis]|uniref:Mbov_0398 family ICE element protein n=1 Tax=[Mycoplasma] collis TaxID=2127 RepID=UPI00051C98AF|nr:hypothetical protein [[Mycoplasma] collis]
MNNKGARFNGKFIKEENITIFNNWKDSINKQGKSLNQVMCDILISHITETENKKIIRNVKDELFYAIRKSQFASNVAIHKQLQLLENKIVQQDKIINLKLNWILNIMFKNVELNKEVYNQPSTKALKESYYFTELNNTFAKNLEKLNNILKAEVKQYEDTYDSFSKTDIFGEVEEDNINKMIKYKEKKNNEV